MAVASVMLLVIVVEVGADETVVITVGLPN